MRFARLVVLATLFTSSSAAAQKTSRLIADFVGSDPIQRDVAGARLLDRGDKAMGVLLPLMVSPDPATRARAAHLINRIRGTAMPGSAGDADGWVVGKNMTVDVVTGKQKTVDLEEGERKVHIVVKPGSIRVEVSAHEYGRPVTVAVEATDPDALRQKSAEAAEVFARWGGGAEVPWQLGSGRVGSGRQSLAGPIQRQRLDIGWITFRAELPLQLEAARVAAEARTEVLALFAELEAARNFEAGTVVNERASDAEITRAVQRVFSFTNRMREKLEELSLPDPGVALAPGAKKRLGAVFNVQRGSLLTIRRLLPQYRGDRMGLRVGDQLTEFNGKQVRTIEQLRAWLMESDGPATIVVLRGGRPVTVVEKPR